MATLATILYEDSKIGKAFPLHHLVLRMVEDDINGQTWRLRKAVEDNPKNGIDQVLADVRATALIAGSGMMFVLADKDRIVRHLNQGARRGESLLAPQATDAEIEAAVRKRSDAPEKLKVFLLHPNMEGLLATAASCAPGQWPEEIVNARKKDRFARDFVLTEISKAAMSAIRACIRLHQPGLDALAHALAALLSDEINS